jgi:hypothetical protein
MEYDADEADKIREPNNWLIGSPARQLVGSSAHWFTKRQAWIIIFFQEQGKPLIFFLPVLFLIERLVQRRLVGSSTCLLVNSSTCRPITFFNEQGIPLQFFLPDPLLN